jgi:HPt (histidine-containing phosphotransfer) domain-containing protein
MNDYLDKPIDISKLARVLMKWVPVEKQENKTVRNEATDAAAADATAPDDEEEIPGTDMQLGVSLNGGKPELFRETLEVFHEDGSDKITQLKDALGKNDLTLYRIFIHGMKSATMSIGAKTLSEFAKSLEMAAKEGSVGYIEENSEKFLAELKALLDKIGEFLNK